MHAKMYLKETPTMACGGETPRPVSIVKFKHKKLWLK
jgi:hypothetical protein